jgi:hypothetical protein
LPDLPQLDHPMLSFPDGGCHGFKPVRVVMGYAADGLRLVCYYDLGLEMPLVHSQYSTVSGML